VAVLGQILILSYIINNFLFTPINVTRRGWVLYVPNFGGGFAVIYRFQFSPIKKSMLLLYIHIYLLTKV